MPKILIAEDNQGTTDMLKTLLEMEGFEVAATHRAQRVVSLAAKECPDALVIDFHLGPENCVSVIRNIRRTPGIANLPVIVVSGMECSLEAEQAGADAFLLKPFGIDMLLDTIKEVLE